MRALAIVSVVGLIACGDDDGRAITPRSDLRTLVGGVLDAYVREVSATCPCDVEDGEFSSMNECLQKLGHEPTFADCVTRELRPSADDALREALHCAMQRYAMRADCLARASCELDAREACYAAAMECPVLDPQALSRALLECPGGTLLGR